MVRRRLALRLRYQALRCRRSSPPLQYLQDDLIQRGNRQEHRLTIVDGLLAGRDVGQRVAGGVILEVIAGGSRQVDNRYLEGAIRPKLEAFHCFVA
ncbi:hypothetical protein D3C85_1705430 [compost metagenome]